MHDWHWSLCVLEILEAEDCKSPHEKCLKYLYTCCLNSWFMYCMCLILFQITSSVHQAPVTWVRLSSSVPVTKMGIRWKAFATLTLLLHIAHSAIDDLPDIQTEATGKDFRDISSFLRAKSPISMPSKLYWNFFLIGVYWYCSMCAGSPACLAALYTRVIGLTMHAYSCGFSFLIQWMYYTVECRAICPYVNSLLLVRSCGGVGHLLSIHWRVHSFMIS